MIAYYKKKKMMSRGNPFPCIEIDQAIIYLFSNGTLITSDLAFARDKSRDTFRLKVVVEENKLMLYGNTLFL
jgi:hypothetical protein